MAGIGHPMIGCCEIDWNVAVEETPRKKEG